MTMVQHGAPHLADPAPGEAMLARFRSVRGRSEDLAAPLSAEDQTIQSMPDVSPTKWHRAHTTWFFETFLLAGADATYQPYDPAFAFLFNSYYETLGPRHTRAQRGLISRPSTQEVTRYRVYVDDAMARLLAAPSSVDLDLLELGLHHEQQHQELMLMDILHVLSMNPSRPVYAAAVGIPVLGQHSSEWSAHPGGLVEVGASPGGFAFDNERPRHRQYLTPFRLAPAPVSTADWREFIDDGGYQRPELWLSDGWAAVAAEGWTAPLYWFSEGGSWWEFGLDGCHPLVERQPVCHISYYEADAYARWASARLPTEAEWESAFAGTDSANDVGVVWEWTASSYSPYPGFRPAVGAVGEYNGKFMVNQYVLRGGSCATSPGHTRATYRNFFPASARWAFSGLRLARDDV